MALTPGWVSTPSVALSVAAQNKIWGQSPDVTAADITFPTCPPGAPGAPDTCVRVDVFRNQRTGGSPLPMFCGQIVGLTQQGVRATATAQMYVGDETDCVKPFVIADKWQEVNDGPGETIPWTPDDTFETMDSKGNPIPNPDVYTPPSGDSCGTGYCLPGDYGLAVTLKNGNPKDAIAPSFFHAVDLPNSCGTGGPASGRILRHVIPRPSGPAPY